MVYTTFPTKYFRFAMGWLLCLLWFSLEKNKYLVTVWLSIGALLTQDLLHQVLHSLLLFTSGPSPFLRSTRHS